MKRLTSGDRSRLIRDAARGTGATMLRRKGRSVPDHLSLRHTDERTHRRPVVLPRAKDEILMAVDPSIRDCGVAVWKYGRLVDWLLIHPRDKEEPDEYVRTGDVFRQIKAVYERWSCTKIIEEVPAHWANEGYAARESGNLPKLVFLCGMIAAGFPCKVVLVQPHEWKGQMKKEQMRYRLAPEMEKEYGIQMFGRGKINHNILDAIGIGKFYVHGGV